MLATVNTLVDETDGSITDGDVSLRDAIAAAAPHETIDFSVTGTITLDPLKGELIINKSLTIDGPGADLLTIRSTGNSRVINIDDDNGSSAIDVTLDGLTITGGNVAGNGGGIRSVENLNITGSTISGNQTTGNNATGGGIYSNGAITLTNSTVSGNHTEGTHSGGGGIFSLGDVTLTNSTLSGNHTTNQFGYGGGIMSEGGVTLTNSTLSGNETQGSDADGGGIWAYAVTLSHSTVASNEAQSATSRGGGLFLFGSAGLPVTITNSIVAKNTAGEGNPDLQLGSGTATVRFSLIGDSSSTNLAEAQTPDANGNLIGRSPTQSGAGIIDPLLGALAANGGLTFTHALLAGSPAINAGDPNFAGTPTTDQRGAGFPRKVGARIDMGAFEQVGSAFRPNTGFTQNALDPGDDDNFVGPVPIGFNANFFGTTYSQLFVNNNGNITFGSGLSDFTPEDLLQTHRIIIAPFWADVDTSGIGTVTYGQDIVDGRPAFGVNWSGVGYFDSQTDKTNTFQLVLIDRSDIAHGAFDFEFNYAAVQWETGEADDGVNGLGGESARAGYSNGEDRSSELPGSGANGALLDTNSTTGLIFNSRNSSVMGRYRFEVRDGIPDGPLAVNDVATTGTGQPVTINVLSNDSDANGQLNPSTVAIVNHPAHGVVVIDASTGAVTYTPNSAFAGQDSFTYTVMNDSGVVSNIATVTIAVAAPGPVVDLNGPEQGVNLTRTATIGDAVALGAFGPATISDSGSEHLSKIEIQIIQQPRGANGVLTVDVGATGIKANFSGGTLTLSADGQGESIAAFQQVLRTLAYQDLAAVDSGGVPQDVVIKVTASDDSGQSATAQATITFSKRNVDPGPTKQTETTKQIVVTEPPVAVQPGPIAGGPVSVATSAESSGAGGGDGDDTGGGGQVVKIPPPPVDPTHRVLSPTDGELQDVLSQPHIPSREELIDRVHALGEFELVSLVAYDMGDEPVPSQKRASNGVEKSDGVQAVKHEVDKPPSLPETNWFPLALWSALAGGGTMWLSGTWWWRGRKRRRHLNSPG